MNEKEISRIIQEDMPRRESMLNAKNYYKNENDIKIGGVVPSDNSKDPLRNADNRISHNFHQLMVDEKASYMFTYPVMFDIENKQDINNRVKEVLGDEFECLTKELCIESSNTGVAWIHYWKDEEEEFQYAKVDSEQIIPIYDDTLKKNLISVYRYYSLSKDGKDITVFENWTKDTLDRYVLSGGINATDHKILEEENISHSLETVPFVEFYNNNKKKSDLDKYKDLIDLYDKVMSGYANDLEDIQQVIYILENYGGTDLKEFLGDLKRYKAIKTENDGVGGGGGVKTLQIDIPVEARNNILEILKKQIYESGQGLQQDTESFGNASGVALKFFYRKLELKSGLTETEFKKGFSKLIRIILKELNIKENISITQTYTRNMISNDSENAEIARNSMGLIPQKIILRNHPWIDDPEEAEKMLKEEQKEEDPYTELINHGGSNE